MANRKFFVGMLVMPLVFGMTVIGCNSDTEKADTWTNVTSLFQLNGTWKYSFDSEVKANAEGDIIKLVSNFTIV